MSKLFTSLLILITLQCFGQDDFELYTNLTSKSSIIEHQKISLITEYKSEVTGEKVKTEVQYFLKNGYPKTIIKFNKQGQVSSKTEFIYDIDERIHSIETYKMDVHQSSTEFELNRFGQISTYIEYVYSSNDGEKLFLWKTLFEYNPNSTIKKSIKLQGYNSDTAEINLYNGNGVKKKTILNMSGLRTTKIDYVYNSDSSEMLENHFDTDSTIYLTIIHKYKNNFEVEKIDPASSNQVIYWKHDEFGRIIETNEAVFFITYYKYNSDGFIINKTWEEVIFYPNVKDIPRKIEFEYEYE